jgi:nucleoside-diphosphate-sugar epimerase
MRPVTVLGARGFIGSHLVRRLREFAIETFAPARGENLIGRNLGEVIYCIGLTSDFRQKPFETVDAHVCQLLQVLRDCDFDSLLYLSSTRVYKGSTIASEDDVLSLQPSDGSDLYNGSKIMGESLALNSGRKVRVARLSNVYGRDLHSNNFLSSLIRDAITRKKIVLDTALDSEKDYVSINEVVDLLLKVARNGQHVIYNVASGTNTSHGDICNRLREITECEIEVVPDASTVKFPFININRIKQEFAFQPANLLDRLEELVSSYRL